MRIALAAAALLCAGIFLAKTTREKSLSPASVRQPLQDKSAMTGELSEGLPEGAPYPSVNSSYRATGAGLASAGVLETIEHLAQNERAEALENIFERSEDLPANEKAALIDAAISLDDPRLLARAEMLALKMLNDGGAAEVLAVLPKVTLFPETSPLHSIAQESFCRFSGFPFEIVKLKFDRIFQHGRPWASVCKTS